MRRSRWGFTKVQNPSVRTIVCLFSLGCLVSPWNLVRNSRTAWPIPLPQLSKDASWIISGCLRPSSKFAYAMDCTACRERVPIAQRSKYLETVLLNLLWDSGGLATLPSPCSSESSSPRSCSPNQWSMSASMVLAHAYTRYQNMYLISGDEIYLQGYRSTEPLFLVNTLKCEPLHIHAQSKVNRVKRHRVQCTRDPPFEQLLWTLLCAPRWLRSMLDWAVILSASVAQKHARTAVWSASVAQKHARTWHATVACDYGM